MVTAGVESASTTSDTFHSKFVRDVDREAVFDSGSYFIALSPLVIGATSVCLLLNDYCDVCAKAKNFS